LAKNGWFRRQRTLAAKKRKKRKIGMFFMCLLRLFAANPQSPNRVQSFHFYDPCTAIVAFLAHAQSFPANQWNCLFMNNIHAKLSYSGQA